MPHMHIHAYADAYFLLHQSRTASTGVAPAPRRHTIGVKQSTPRNFQSNPVPCRHEIGANPQNRCAPGAAP